MEITEIIKYGDSAGEVNKIENKHKMDKIK